MQSALEQVCSLLPATISSECTSFVDVYTPAIVNLLVQEIKPIEVCKKLGVCPSVSKSQQGKIVCKELVFFGDFVPRRKRLPCFFSNRFNVLVSMSVLAFP